MQTKQLIISFVSYSVEWNSRWPWLSLTSKAFGDVNDLNIATFYTTWFPRSDVSLKNVISAKTVIPSRAWAPKPATKATGEENKN